MIKKIIKILSIIALILILFISYFSIFGINTTKFNNQIKNKISSLMKLKKGLSDKDFNNSFEYNLYETINWYIKHFKKKL